MKEERGLILSPINEITEKTSKMRTRKRTPPLHFYVTYTIKHIHIYTSINTHSLAPAVVNPMRDGHSCAVYQRCGSIPSPPERLRSLSVPVQRSTGMTEQTDGFTVVAVSLLHRRRRSANTPFSHQQHLEENVWRKRMSEYIAVDVWSLKVH